MGKYLRPLFILFLFGYAFCIGIHLLQITWNLYLSILFFAGITLAVGAHAKKNYITIIILIVHMGIEYFEWSKETDRLRTLLFNGIHTLMDFIFLSHELKVHIKKYRTMIIVCSMGILGTIFYIGNSTSMEINSIQMLEPFVLGGVLGCVLSHIYFHAKKE